MIEKEAKNIYIYITILNTCTMILINNDTSTHPTKPSITSDVIPWDDVIKYINKKELFKLKRSKKQTDRYHKHKDELKKQHITVSQFILQMILKWDANEIYELNHIKYVTVQQQLKAILTNEQLFKVTINDFPYNYEPNVLHLLIWSKIKLPIYINDTTDIDGINIDHNKYPDMNPECERLIDKFLSRTLHDKYKLSYGVNYVWFVNYLSLQSIKDLSHIHVLIKFHSEQEKLKMANILTQDGQFRSLVD